MKAQGSRRETSVHRKAVLSSSSTGVAGPSGGGHRCPASVQLKAREGSEDAGPEQQRVAMSTHQMTPPIPGSPRINS